MMLPKYWAAASKPDPEADVESKSANEDIATDDVEDGRVAGNYNGRNSGVLGERIADVCGGRTA